MRQPTPEQQAGAKERREKFRALAAKVARMTDEEKAHLTARLGAVPTCAGRVLSLHNSLLCLMQCPSVSMVGGFRQWLAAGRCVRKGEHGFMIWIPLGKKDGSASEESGEATPDDGRFLMATVFDVSQTEPKSETATPEPIEA